MIWEMTTIQSDGTKGIAMRGANRRAYGHLTIITELMMTTSIPCFDSTSAHCIPSHHVTTLPPQPRTVTEVGHKYYVDLTNITTRRRQALQS